MHYSQEHSTLELSPDPSGRSLRVSGTGIVSRALVREQLRRYLETPAGARASVLIDLRGIAGYGYGCAAMARRALQQAARGGTRRIALVSSSAVMRTMTAVLGTESGVALRCFPEPEDACAWLEGRGPRS